MDSLIAEGIASPARGREGTTHWNMRRWALLLLTASLVLAAGSAQAREHTAREDGPAAAAKHDSPHTITWWCVDLNELWHVDVPVLVGWGVVTPPDPSPIPPCTDSTFPIVVKAGQGWTTGGAAIWSTNKVYPPAVAAALRSIGYHFLDNSPIEDLMKKTVEIRYVVRTFPDDVFVAQYSFDPRKIFRLVQARQFFGDLALDPIINPDLGINIDSDAAGRLPLLHFAGIGGGLPPGEYRAQAFWVLSELHNDGLGLDDGNFLPPGELLAAQPRFVVVP